MKTYYLGHNRKIQSTTSNACSGKIYSCDFDVITKYRDALDKSNLKNVPYQTLMALGAAFKVDGMVIFPSIHGALIVEPDGSLPYLLHLDNGQKIMATSYRNLLGPVSRSLAFTRMCKTSQFTVTLGGIIFTFEVDFISYKGGTTTVEDVTTFGPLRILSIEGDNMHAALNEEPFKETIELPRTLDLSELTTEDALALLDMFNSAKERNIDPALKAAREQYGDDDCMVGAFLQGVKFALDNVSMIRKFRDKN